MKIKVTAEIRLNFYGEKSTEIFTEEIDINKLKRQSIADYLVDYYEYATSIKKIISIEPAETEEETFTQNQINFAFKVGRHYSSNYHYDTLLKDKNFIKNKKSIY